MIPNFQGDWVAIVNARLERVELIMRCVERESKWCLMSGFRVRLTDHMTVTKSGGYTHDIYIYLYMLTRVEWGGGGTEILEHNCRVLCEACKRVRQKNIHKILRERERERRERENFIFFESFFIFILRESLTKKCRQIIECIILH